MFWSISPYQGVYQGVSPIHVQLVAQFVHLMDSKAHAMLQYNPDRILVVAPAHLGLCTGTYCAHLRIPFVTVEGGSVSAFFH